MNRRRKPGETNHLKGIQIRKKEGKDRVDYISTKREESGKGKELG